jgi:hypothetical protein
MITEEHFNQEIAKLNNKLNAIYQILKEQSTQSSTIVIKPQSIPTGDKIPKNTINWEALSSISDPKTQEIVNGMYSSNYPTVTSGQYKLLGDIGLKHKIDISI